MKQIIIATAIGTVLTACSSSTPNLPQPYKLGTTKLGSSNYYYCESCPAPSKLDRQTSLPLEPDEPIVINHPVATPEVAKTKKHVKRRKSQKRKLTRKRIKKNNPPQCLVWSK